MLKLKYAKEKLYSVYIYTHMYTYMYVCVYIYEFFHILINLKVLFSDHDLFSLSHKIQIHRHSS